MVKVRLASLALAAVALSSSFASASCGGRVGLLAKLQASKASCCEPAPACAPAPEYAPAPTCSEPAPACGGRVGLLAKLKARKAACSEPAPTCCEPAPAPDCCAPAPAPAPVCCEPAPTCGGRVGLLAKLRARRASCSEPAPVSCEAPAPACGCETTVVNSGCSSCGTTVDAGSVSTSEAAPPAAPAAPSASDAPTT